MVLDMIDDACYIYPYETRTHPVSQWEQTEMQTSKVSHEAWCIRVEQRAHVVLGTKMINWREVTFNWAERYLDDEPMATTVDALIVAAQKQLNEAIKHIVT